MIKQTEGLPERTENTSAYTYGGHAFAGVECPLFSVLSMAIEGGYVVGKYQKYFLNDNYDFEQQDVSLNGPQAKVKLMVRF